MTQSPERNSLDKRKLGRHVIRWSDAWEPKAVRKAETYRLLRPKPLTNNQLTSLQNIVESAPEYSHIRDYIRNQADKAGRAGPYLAELRDYWLDMDKTLGDLRNEADKILQELVEDVESMFKKEKKANLDLIQQRLVREYAQHLVAHFFYLTPVGEERSR